jgi:pimeloyl-ACP methyl ester carboxylesterase
LRTRYTEAGAGPIALVLHHSTGPFWTPFYDRLAEQFRVIALEMPGYGQSDRPEAARAPRDIAILSLQALVQLAGANPVHLVGLGFGGWVAAEMATMNQLAFTTLTLVAPAGIRPRMGHIHDSMIGGWTEYARLGFSTDEAFHAVFGAEPPIEVTELWDYSREMTARLTWRPWMWSGQLAALLPGVQTPALVVWGDTDRIVPPDCGEQYVELLPHAYLEIVEGAGHNIEIEKPLILADLVSAFTMKHR